MSRTSPQERLRIVPWTSADFRAGARAAMTIYADAMGYHYDVIDSRTSHAAAHSDRAGFRAVAALDPDGVLRGFGYGYTSLPGQWWHDQVHRAVDEATAAEWLVDGFELCELHVSPQWQGAGTGRQILLQLLEGAPHLAVLLSTPEGENRAWRLYRSLGFVDLARRYLFPGDGRPFAVLGARLPLSA